MRRRESITEDTSYSGVVVWSLAGAVAFGAFWSAIIYTRTEEHEKRITATEKNQIDTLSTVQDIKTDVVRIKTIMEDRDGSRRRNDSSFVGGLPGPEDEGNKNLQRRLREFRTKDEGDLWPKIDGGATPALDEGA